jgi:hypothetical protein
MKQIGMSLRQDRLGILLHELIHCYLQRHMCESCMAGKRYYGNGHGRGFQLIAKAIGENAWSILGVSAHLGRLDSIAAD